MELQADVLWQIWARLSVKQVVIVSQVCKSWHQLANDDIVWKKRCLHDWDSCEIGGVSIAGNPRVQCNSFKALWLLHHSYTKQYGIAYKRAKRIWKKIEDWLSLHAPDIKDTLNPPASEKELLEAERAMNIPRLPNSLRALYTFHNGQRLEESYRGLFGGYSYYHTDTVVWFLPLSYLIRVQNRAGEVVRIVFAATFDHRKLFSIVVATGQVVLESPQEALPVRCCPELINGDCSTDALRWFESYANDLSNDMYEIQPFNEEEPEETKGIWRFPMKGDLYSEETTQGVRVRVSSVFCPEEQRPGFFSYSVRLSLLPEASINSCQLLSRHWVICPYDGPQEEVRGAAVIGLYPHLRPHEKEFMYQSCTTMSGGYMYGEFEMVEGSIQQPTGPKFEVAIPRFLLRQPEFIY